MRLKHEAVAAPVFSFLDRASELLLGRALWAQTSPASFPSTSG